MMQEGKAQSLMQPYVPFTMACTAASLQESQNPPVSGRPLHDVGHTASPHYQRFDSTGALGNAKGNGK